MSTRRLIGVFGTDISSRIQGNLYSQLHKKAAECGYNLFFFSGSYDKINFQETTHASEQLFELANYMNLVAVMIHAQSINDATVVRSLIDMGHRKGVPVYVFDCETLGITKEEGVITINPDYKQGFAEGLKHLIEHHHCKRIFMLAGPKGNQYSEDRIAVFRQEMQRHGIPFSEKQIGYGGFWDEPATVALNEYLDSEAEMPEAICSANDTMAITACRILNKRGYRVPEDVLVTGFDGIEEGRYNYPRISTTEPMLETVADFVFDHLAGKNDAAQFMIPLRFIPKDSSGSIDGYSDEDKRELTRLVDFFRIGAWQHHMISTMQYELINSVDVNEMTGYIYGALSVFKGYKHLYCVREDIETTEDFTTPIELFRVQMNRDFLPDGVYEPFKKEEISPMFGSLLDQIGPKDLFFIQLIHNANNIYGYHIVQGTEYSTNDIKYLTQFTESVTVELESIHRNKRLQQANQKLSEMYERMSDMYIRDTMTGLFNRHGYYSELDQFITREEIKNGYIHIVSVDMDNMKYINDHFGHMEGDAAIIAVAHAINHCFSYPCICARFGGDEFQVALFTEHGEKPSTQKISDKLNNYLQNATELAGKGYCVGVSVGQGVGKISEILDMKELEKMADAQMYEDKKHRKSRDN